MAHHSPTAKNSQEIAQIEAERDFYKRILDNLPAVVHINNLKKQTVEWISEFGPKNSGYSKEEGLDNPNFFEGKLIVEDFDWLRDSIADYQTLEGVYSAIYSMKNKNGTVTTFQNIGVILDYDEDGTPLRNLCVDVDITNEVRNYKQLKTHLANITKRLNKSIIKCLTPCELEVITLLCQGHTVNEIAEQLHRSHHTIESHKRNIFKKLDIHKTRELAIWAKEVGII